MKKLLLPFLLILLSHISRSQACSSIGQTPSTAFPVCGTKIFNQAEVPICRTRNIVVPGCTGDGADYGDKNPYWYKFTCYVDGMLGFLITPKDLGDDYDWQLYDVTNRNVNDVFTNASTVVTGNWAGTYGVTGASNNGVSFIQCASVPDQNRNSFSKMPVLKKGHEYLLLVSHYTQSQSGYTLSFGGGTAVITDPVLPSMKGAEAACSGNLIRLKLGKKIKCSSIAVDGSEFFIKGTNVKGISSAGVDCSAGFDTDSIVIKLDGNLAPGTYQLAIKKGVDGNTLLDYCDNAIPETDVIAFTVFPIAPTPMDSLQAVVCSPQQLKLIFRKPMDCSSVAANGSDFTVTGTYGVSVVNAKGTCNTSGLFTELIITLDKPLQRKGDFVLTLKRGDDGNTLLDECAQETPAGSSLSFSIKDTVNADFTYSIQYGCTVDVVNYFHPGTNEVNSWKWNLDENKTSPQQSPQANYSIFNQKNVSLIVSNGFCSDTAKQTVQLENFLKADFTVTPDNCPLEPVSFTSTAQGKIVAYEWVFGDGSLSNEASPKHSYLQPERQTSFGVRYTVTDSYGCKKTVTKSITIYSSCTIYVPNAFTPGNDGRNDVFRVLNAVKAENFALKIYNRWGQAIFETKDWKQGWDGRYKGQLQGTGTYVWTLSYRDTRSGERVQKKGTVTLIR
jgi:gliding motility-associated-like protein